MLFCSQNGHISQDQAAARASVPGTGSLRHWRGFTEHVRPTRDHSWGYVSSLTGHRQQQHAGGPSGTEPVAALEPRPSPYRSDLAGFRWKPGKALTLSARQQSCRPFERSPDKTFMPDGSVCHFYSTIPIIPTSRVFICWHKLQLSPQLSDKEINKERRHCGCR